jgi:NarL family two-component system response regulator LiaR
MAKDNDPIKIVLVDDHQVLRSGLKYIIDVIDDLEVVAEASNGIEAVKKCAELLPDVVLMDLLMPEMDGVEATRIILRENPRIRVIALTSFKEEEKIQAALEAGAVSYLTKDITIDDLSEAVHKAYAGIPTLSPEATRALINARMRPPSPGSDLTPREMEVLEYMVSGLSNPAIAEKLTVSRSTVKKHVSNVLWKLGASSRTEAVALALKEKIVPAK